MNGIKGSGLTKHLFQPVNERRQKVQLVREPFSPVDEALLPEWLNFDALFRRFSPYVGGIALSILGSPDEVDDLVQEVFIDAYRGLRKLREANAVKAWLATVTVRHARQRLRARRFRQFLRLDCRRDYEQAAEASLSPEQRALLAELFQALDTLPVDERLAWTLRYVEREQLNNVAILCGCSLATAKRRIAAATVALQRMIADA